MDRNNLVLKENYSFLVADAAGQVGAGEQGLYNRDTRFLNRYRWDFGDGDFGDGVQALLIHSPRPDSLHAHHARIEGPSQLVAIRRDLALAATTLTDTLTLENSSAEVQRVSLELHFAADFIDLFEARGWVALARDPVRVERQNDRVTLRYTAKDGLMMATTLHFSPAPHTLTDESAVFSFVLAPKASVTLTVRGVVENPLEAEAPSLGYDHWGYDRWDYDRWGYDRWRTAFKGEVAARYQGVVARAVDDLRALLLFTKHGPLPAAGIPWFVAAFGRDALLTAFMMLPHTPEVAEGTLRYLAAHQGKTHDAYRAEAPGKIMHEHRFGELSRIGKAPHTPYYGTVDATALFIVLLYEGYRHTGDLRLVRELRPHWEAALSWLTGEADVDGDGFLEFRGGEPQGAQGLSVQSWKDSGDSLGHADGRLATGDIAVSEVQGYAYAAYRAAADFYQALGEGDQAAPWHTRAATLKQSFHEAFWLEPLATYAMALDGDKTPLAVHNSNAGQLLWSGIVPDEIAPRLVATLMSETNWSGWGVRTLGTSALRYNPVSYHNGSVWPHDNALIAGGLARYGFRAEAARIREATFELALTQTDKRLPELVAGYARTNAPPVPYPTACRPQAWDAAALLYLLHL